MDFVASMYITRMEYNICAFLHSRLIFMPRLMNINDS